MKISRSIEELARKVMQEVDTECRTNEMWNLLARRDSAVAFIALLDKRIAALNNGAARATMAEITEMAKRRY